MKKTLYIILITLLAGLPHIALLLAAMSAKGTSEIGNIEQIDRGYQDIENRLNSLGARIVRKA